MATAIGSVSLGIKSLGFDTLLTDLPLDVLIQIIGWLHPWDILMLSRTTKSFRSYLMSRTSRATIWVPALKALDDLDIPKCPETMSEPRFIHLLYDTVCDDCGDVEESKLVPMYEVQNLLCYDCQLKRYAPLREIIKDKPLPWGARELDDMGVDYMHGSHWTMELTWEEGDPDKRDDEPPRIYHIDSIVTLQTRWDACQQDENAKSALAQEATCEYKEQQNWASNCREFRRREDWEELVTEAILQNERRERRQRMRKEREEKVKERLIGLGYEEEVGSFFSTTNHYIAELSTHYKLYKEKFREQSAELTDDEWTTIKDDMVGIMLAERHWWEVFMGAVAMKDLIASTFKPAFVAYAFSQPPNTVLPTPKEVALMPEWVAALSTGTAKNGANPKLVAAAVAAMPAFCDGVRAWRVEQVLDLVRKSKTYSGRENHVSFDVLTLASTVFSCRVCDDRMTYPNVLVHGCNYVERSRQNFGTVNIPDTARVIERTVGEPATWSTRPLAALSEEVIAACRNVSMHSGRGSFWNDLCNVSFDDAGHEHVLNLLDSLGMDRKAPASDLEMQQPYVEVRCQCFKVVGSSSSKNPGPRTVMRWIKAIQMSRAHDVPEKRKNWFAKPSKAYLSLVPDAEAIRRSEQSVQACFWSLGGPPLRIMPHRLYAEGEGQWESRFNQSEIVHPEGADAAREYADTRNLEAFARLVHEKPLKPAVRRSGRKRFDDAVLA